MCTLRTAWSNWLMQAPFSFRERPYTAAKQFVEVESLGLQTIRGIAAPIEIFKLRDFSTLPQAECSEADDD